MKLALKLFSPTVVSGLLELGPSRNDLFHYQQTAEYIKIFCSWWDVVNVKSTSKGICKLNVLSEPFTGNPQCENTIFLNKFI